jgi:hypothetical protein
MYEIPWQTVSVREDVLFELTLISLVAVALAQPPVPATV